jgi:radical SAM protein with 4Fe4S-binding SPASM domain
MKKGLAPDQMPYPIALSLEPTTACNLGCSQCPSGLKSFSRPTGNLAIEEGEKWLTELKDYLFYINFYFQGEPLIHPNLSALIKHAKSINVRSAISTNGHFLSETKCQELIDAGLSKIIISVDGLTQESYEKYRAGGELNKVLDGIRTLQRKKKENRSAWPLIEVQFIVFKQNEHEIPQLKKVVKTLGADVLSLKTAQIYDQSSAEELLPSNKKYLRYEQNDSGEFVLKNKFKNACWRMWSSAVITQNGAVVPCCFDKDAEYEMGDLRADGYNNILNGATYKAFRERVFTNRKSIDICRNCSEGSKIY